MKEYFSHDYHARSDRKLVNLRMKMGWEGVGLYWCIIEMLYENNGAINLSEIERIAFELGTQSERITELLKGFELFRFRGGVFYSDSVNERLEKRSEKSDKARLSAVTRWDRERNKDANAMRTHTDRNAIKVKKSKVKEKSIEKMPDGWDGLWDRWMKYRQDIKKPFKSKDSEQANMTYLKNLSSNDLTKAERIVEQTIANGWVGLFKLKEEPAVEKKLNFAN